MKDFFMQLLEFGFSGFWAFIGFLLVIGLISHTFASIITRLFRMIMVSLRGWPENPNLDADGDFKKETYSKETTKLND